MRRAIGRWIAGFVAGWWLSRMRAQAGADLMHWAMADVGTAMTWRAVALFGIAIVLWSASTGLAWSAIAAAALGYAVHGLCFGIQGGLGAFSFVLAAIAVSVGLAMASGLSPKAPDSDDSGSQPVNAGEMIGLVVAGGGVAIALESIARHVRLFGAGLSQDDSVFGAAFLLLTALGAASFGWIATKKSVRRLSFPFLLAATAAACFLALRLVDRIADAKGLAPFMRRWGLDSSQHGTLGWDALVGGAAFVVPAFVLGTALVAARGKRSLWSVFAGAGIGLIVLPRLLAHDSGAGTGQVQIFSAQLVPLACLVTIAGAAFAILCEAKRGRARYIALALTLVCGAPALITTVKPIFVLSPWAARPVMPYLAFETPEGLATVEPSKGGLKVATLDRRLITPTTSDYEVDLQRIRLSFQLASGPMRPTQDLKVLFLGQITPVRAAGLLAGQASVVDRSAAWSSAMARLEGELFKAQDGQTGVAPPAGEILTPKAARERFERGDYDLVIAPAIEGDTPRVEFLKAPEKTVVVRWLSAAEPLRGVGRVESSRFVGKKLERHDEVVLSAEGFEDLSFGVMTNVRLDFAATGTARGIPGIAALGRETRTPRPLGWLTVRETFRGDDARDDAATRLFVASVGTPKPRVLAMQHYYSAQVPSSPYETVEQRVELGDDVLIELAKMHDQAELDAFDRQLWEWIARILLGKRDIERIDRYLEPMATKFAPWSALEITLARADLEALDPEHAIERLTTLLGKDDARASPDIFAALGDAYEQAGDAARAEKARRDTLARWPDWSGNRYVARKLAIALFKSGSPEGRMKLQEILLASPDDDEVKNLLDPAPAPVGPPPRKP
jgi:tetratricopeptide (TPR) repeat protein